MNDAGKLLTELAIDPYLRAAYARNPQQVLARARVTAAELAAPAVHETFAACCTCSDPGFDPMPSHGPGEEDDSSAVTAAR
ncbi:MAG: hypothetical protein RL701_6722 [Pseudomonadota bacterium]